MTQERIKKAKSRLKELKRTLKSVKRERKSDSSDIVELLDKLHDSYSSRDVVKTLLDRRMRIRVYERTKWNSNRVKSKEYRVAYKEKGSDSNRTTVFKLKKTDMHKLFGGKKDLKVYKKDWKNWEDELEEQVYNQVFSELTDEIAEVKKELKEDYNYPGV